MTFEKIPYKRPLVIGMGGGNDIVSSTLILSDLINAGKNPDLAGMCSPAAWHFYDGEKEKSVNIVTEKTRRYRPSKNPVNLSFIDPKVPKLLEERGIKATVYNLSLRYGTSALIKGLQKLIEKQKYDGIIAVDIGGDVFARGSPDPTIVSPLMDFTALYVISQLKIPSTLIEFGFQTDGELRPKGCEEIMNELQTSGLLKDTLTIKSSDKPVEIFRKIYSGIEHIRHGHTAHMTLETLNSKEDIHTKYKRRTRILNKRWYHEFPITLEAKYFGKAFIIDLKGLEKSRKLAFPYETPLELYIKTKKIVDTGTEMDMLYAWTNNTCLWLGLLYPYIKGNERKEILNYGLDKLNTHADAALLWKKDIDVINNSIKTSLDDFVLTGESAEKVLRVADEIKNILKI